jgi:signal transduction histidine kinase/CheY-like chemotaxis protein
MFAAKKISIWLKQRGLRVQLTLGFATVIFLAIIVGAIAIANQLHSQKVVNRLVDQDERVARLASESKIDMLTAWRHEENFLGRQKQLSFDERKARYVTLACSHQDEARESMTAISDANIAADVTQTAQAIKKAAGECQTNFLRVVDLYEQRFRNGTGLESQLRNLREKIEGATDRSGDDALLHDKLILIASETGYFLRGLDADVSGVKETIGRLRTDAARSRLTASEIGTLQNLTDSYLALFAQIAQADAQIADEIDQHAIQTQAVMPLLDSLQEKTMRAVNDARVDLARVSRATFWITLITILAATALGIVVAHLTSKKIAHGVIQCMHFAKRVANGDLKTRLSQAGEAEFGALTAGLNEMAEQLEETYQQLRSTNVQLEQERRRADEANGAKSEFLSRMSHELRTPLNAILGFGQLLERQNPTATQQTHLGHIMKGGRHLLNLINEVLEISRIEAGRLQLSLEAVCVADILSETLDLVQPLALEHATKLSLPAKPEPSIYVLADRQRLKQVLINLLGNAIKYTPMAGTVKCSVVDLGGETLRIKVADSGPGIPVEKLSRLFVPFDRLGAEQSAVEGTGLGLALCQRLMQAMNGSIGAESALRGGSTFWVELPRTESPLNRIAPALQANAIQMGRGLGENQRTILCVEDNESNLTLIEQLLKDEPHLVLLTTKNGGDAAAFARSRLPDLILLDLHLPDVPGWEILAELKAAEETRDIPVVVISADATARQIDRLIAAGAHSYLTKPIDVSEFFRVIEKALKVTAPPQCVAA